MRVDFRESGIAMNVWFPTFRMQIFLDGKNVTKHCFSFDTQEGWVNRYKVSADGAFAGGHGGSLVVEHLTGNVEVDMPESVINFCRKIVKEFGYDE